jgi:hypothetical protein
MSLHAIVETMMIDRVTLHLNSAFVCYRLSSFAEVKAQPLSNLRCALESALNAKSIRNETGVPYGIGVSTSGDEEG